MKHITRTCHAGLERVPWLVNGTGTSYMDVFHNALEYLKAKVGVEIDDEVWDKYGPYSCLLNVDEVEDLEKTWDWIADKVCARVCVCLCVCVCLYLMQRRF